MKLPRILVTTFAALFAALVAVCPAPTLAGEGARTPKPVIEIAGEGARTPKPVIEIAGEGKCVAPPDEMRKNHMEMLKHQRDRTLRQGIRGEPASLNACIECHASKKTGSVLGASENGKGTNFCESCHSYVAVKLDCFECHQAKAKFKAAGLKP